MFERFLNFINAIDLIHWATFVIVALTIVGSIIYAFTMLFYLLSKIWFKWTRFETFMEAAPPEYMFGLPISSATAFALVSVLYTVVPPAKAQSADSAAQPVSEDKRPAAASSKDQFSFEAFGAKFSGPAAPGTLWVVCYLTFVASVRIIRPSRERPGRQQNA